MMRVLGYLSLPAISEDQLQEETSGASNLLLVDNRSFHLQ